jgi:DNA-binding PadR family transcriptional regulator
MVKVPLTGLEIGFGRKKIDSSTFYETLHDLAKSGWRIKFETELITERVRNEDNST